MTLLEKGTTSCCTTPNGSACGSRLPVESVVGPTSPIVIGGGGVRLGDRNVVSRRLRVSHCAPIPLLRFIRTDQARRPASCVPVRLLAR